MLKIIAWEKSAHNNLKQRMSKLNRILAMALVSTFILYLQIEIHSRINENKTKSTLKFYCKAGWGRSLEISSYFLATTWTNLLICTFLLFSVCVYVCDTQTILIKCHKTLREYLRCSSLTLFSETQNWHSHVFFSFPEAALNNIYSFFINSLWEML